MGASAGTADQRRHPFRTSCWCQKGPKKVQWKFLVCIERLNDVDIFFLSSRKKNRENGVFWPIATAEEALPWRWRTYQQCTQIDVYNEQAKLLQRLHSFRRDGDSYRKRCVWWSASAGSETRWQWPIGGSSEQGDVLLLKESGIWYVDQTVFYTMPNCTLFLFTS